jgi:hypothetical protein
VTNVIEHYNKDKSVMAIPSEPGILLQSLVNTGPVGPGNWKVDCPE